jgi:hypothetical protein
LAATDANNWEEVKGSCRGVLPRQLGELAGQAHIDLDHAGVERTIGLDDGPDIAASPAAGPKALAERRVVGLGLRRDVLAGKDDQAATEPYAGAPKLTNGRRCPHSTRRRQRAVCSSALRDAAAEITTLCCTLDSDFRGRQLGEGPDGDLRLEPYVRWGGHLCGRIKEAHFCRWGRLQGTPAGCSSVGSRSAATAAVAVLPASGNRTAAQCQRLNRQARGGWPRRRGTGVVRASLEPGRPAGGDSLRRRACRSNSRTRPEAWIEKRVMLSSRCRCSCGRPPRHVLGHSPATGCSSQG